MKKGFLPFAPFITLGMSLTLNAQWEAVTTNLFPTNHRVWDIQMVNENIIWAFSSYDAFPPPTSQLPIVHRSTDGGSTWQSFPIPGMGGVAARDLSAVDAMVAYITLPQNGLFRTLNGGADWELVTVSASLPFPFFVHFYNANEGWVFGRKTNGHPVSAITADGGATWMLIDETNAPPYLSNEFFAQGFATNSGYDVAGDAVVISTSLGYYWQSNNKAQSWERVSNPMSEEGLWMNSIALKDESTIMLATDYTGSAFLPTVAYTSTDGGETWTESAPGVTPGAIHYLPGSDGTFILSGHNNIIPANEYGTAITFDSGLTWEKIDDTRLISVDFLDEYTGIGVLGKIVPLGSQGEVFKWTAQVIGNRFFVNDDATGANDGTSWENAFTDLQSALAIAQEGDQIWVAEGTYLPGPDPASTFLIDKNIQLYGGFNGTEATLAERGNPAEHPTILSGDVNGDDVVDDFVNFKTDNVMHVMRVTSDVSNEALIDGFTIEGGHADGLGTGEPKSGGGIYSIGGPTIRNCTFEQNFATEFGGAIGQGNNSSAPLVLDNCIFQNNRAFEGLAVHLTLASFEVNNCTFKNNTNENGNAGGLYLLNPRGGKVKNSVFKENVTNMVGGMIAWNQASANLGNVFIEVLDCTFENNVSLFDGFDQGGGGLIFVTGADNSRHVAKRCSFIGNTSNANGGAMCLQFNTTSENASMLIDSCYFFQNITKNNGSAVYTAIMGKTVDLELSRCEFIQNTTELYSSAVDFWGTNGATGDALIDNCIFENNTSGYSGALEMGNGHNGGASVDFTLTNSTFKNNQAMEGGAAGFWSNQSSVTNVAIENCWWENNAASSKGGAILFSPGNNFNATVLRSTFLNNQSPDGGAIESFVGAPLPANASVTIENSLIAGHTSTNAAISAEYLPNLHLLNCTIADNNGGIELADKSSLTLQNTILANPGQTEYTAATPDVTATSNGGNLVLDSSLNTVLTAQDKPETEPGFMSGTYEPSATSPLVNAGVNDGVTATTDLAGNERIQQGIVDIGAFESPFLPTSVWEIVGGEIGLAPNPATDLLYLDLPATAKPTRFDIFDAQGRLVQTGTFSEGVNLQVGHLPGGVFTLKMTDGERVYVGRFVKQ